MTKAEAFKDCGKGCTWCDGDCQNFGVPIPRENEWKSLRPMPPRKIYGGTLKGDDGSIISHFPDQEFDSVLTPERVIEAVKFIRDTSPTPKEQEQWRQKLREQFTKDYTDRFLKRPEIQALLKKGNP